MEKLRKRWQALLSTLNANGAALAFAHSRHRRFHGIAEKAHNAEVEATKKADAARRRGNLARAARYDRIANRKHRRSQNAHLKAQAWIGRIKQLIQRRDGLLHTKAELKAELAEYQRQHKITIIGNQVTGGTKRERLKACALASAAACASGRRPNFYSQAGAWDVGRCITGETRGERSDCSSWVTSAYKSCGLPDPNGNRFGGGYTGTLGSHGRSISRGDLKPGDLILYGSYPHHHVEMFVGPGTKTIGHGSAPVDPGVVDLISGPKTYRSYV